MALFDLMLDQSLELEVIRDYVEGFEPMFEAINADIDDYNWETIDLGFMRDLDYLRAFILDNLVCAAQDVGLFPQFMDICDFDFTDGISFNISNYHVDEVNKIRTALKRFENKTGVKVNIIE